MGCGGSKPETAQVKVVKMPSFGAGMEHPSSKEDAAAAPAPATEATAAAAAPAAEPSKKVTLEDFEVTKVLGKGAFGKVSLAIKKDTGEKFAIKTLNKQMLVAVKQVKGAMTEASVLKQERHPCVVAMYYSFQDETSLHMVLDFMPGGDLYDRIEEEETIPPSRAKLYGAEIASALGHLHDRLQIIYRDIKPENILIDEKGHAKLTDFGLVKGGGGGGGGSSKGLVRGTSFVGTLEYMAPEVMKQSGDKYTKAVDWWGLGVLLHEMLHGATPFCAETQNAVQRAVLGGQVEVAAGTPDLAAAFLKRLLVRTPEERLGSSAVTGSADVQSDAYWAPLTFDKVYAREYTPEWKPGDPVPGAASKDAEEEEEKKGEGEGESGDDLEGSDEEDDDFDDEWHMLVQGAPPPKLSDFQGFSFARDTTWQPKDVEAKPTRLVQRRKSSLAKAAKLTKSGKAASLETVDERI